MFHEYNHCERVVHSGTHWSDEFESSSEYCWNTIWLINHIWLLSWKVDTHSVYTTECVLNDACRSLNTRISSKVSKWMAGGTHNRMLYSNLDVNGNDLTCIHLCSTICGYKSKYSEVTKKMIFDSTIRWTSTPPTRFRHHTLGSGMLMISSQDGNPHTYLIPSHYVHASFSYCLEKYRICLQTLKIT